MKFVFSALIFLVGSVCVAQKKYMLVGTYTQGKSVGIYVYNFDTNTGSATIVDSIKTSNPSYLAVSPDQKFVYAVNENNDHQGNGGKVTAFSFNKATGHLVQLNEQPSMGDDPCYITVDKTGKWVIVGNYSSGTVAVLPIQKDGSLSKAVSIVQHKGSSINKQRQESAHVHETVLSPNNRQLFVPDLGIDKLMLYSFNEHNGKLTPAKDTAIKLTPGSGPRHFVLHPNGKWAYLIQEMGGTITAFNYNKGALKKMQISRTVPDHFKKSFSTAEIFISPDCRFLYASNRDSANTIAIFKIDAVTGKLSSLGYEPTLGKTPRFFNLDPTANYLLVANQNSDNIVVFKRNIKTGLLRNTEKHISVGNPVCIQWIQ